MSNDGQPKNPFAQGGANPFGANPKPAQGFNPFAPPQQPSSPDPSQSATGQAQPAQQLNPLAAPAAQPSGGNPFAVQSGSMSPLAGNPQPASLAQPSALGQAQAAPAAFDAPLQPKPSAVANQANVNVFAQPAPEPEPAPAFAPQGASADPFGGDFGAEANAQYEAERNLAPLEFAPSEVPLNSDYVLPELTEGLIKRQTAFTMAASAGGIALLFGFLFGFLIDQRQEHNRRVDEWQKINEKLQRPLEQVAALEAAIPDANTLRKWIATRAPIKREDLDKIPDDLTPISTDILAPYEALDPAAMKKLGELVVSVNRLFEEAKEHRQKTIRIAFRGDGKKPFSDYKMYAIDLGGLASRKSVKLKGVMHYIKAQKAPRIVAIKGDNIRAMKQSKLKVIGSDLKERTVSNHDLIPVVNGDLLGFGVTPLALYHQALIKLRSQLNRIKVTQRSFETKLKERLAEQKVFTL